MLAVTSRLVVWKTGLLLKNQSPSSHASLLNIDMKTDSFLAKKYGFTLGLKRFLE